MTEAMRMRDPDIQEELRAWLKGASKVLVAGIGNPIRRDDHVGVRIVADLRGKVSEAVHLIECETVPESFVDEIIGIAPSHVLLIDAALLGLSPGEARLLEPEQVTGPPALSTHSLPLKVFCEYVRKMTGARIALLLIEPKDTGFGEGLTAEIEMSAASLGAILLRALPWATFDARSER